jgi:transposase
MARERWLFSEEFKGEAVKPVGQPGASKAAIARDLGIGANLLGRWCRDANVDAEVVSGGEKVSSQEYERMPRELLKVKTERDILNASPSVASNCCGLLKRRMTSMKKMASSCVCVVSPQNYRSRLP